MNFVAKTESEIQAMNLLPDGSYAFEVMEANDKISKAGNEMIQLQLRIYDQHDRPHMVFDYLMEQMAYKLLHFCAATDLQLKYSAGTLSASDCNNKKGFVEIYTQEGVNGYSAKNSVKDYLVSKQNDMLSPEKKAEEDFLDCTDLPF